MDTGRHLNAILARVARDFICATAEGFGLGIAATYRELIVARARFLRRPVLRRYRLTEVTAIRIRRGGTISFLLIEVRGCRPTTIMVLYGAGAAPAFDDLAAVLERRCPRLARRRAFPQRRSA